MLHGQAHHTCGGSHIAGLAPQEVALLISAHLAALSGLALVALHGKGILPDTLGISERIVPIHVDMRMLVLPEYVECRIPLIIGFVEGVAHVVAAVAFHLQCAGVASFVVDDIYAHHVTIHKTVVVYPRHGHLVDFAGEFYLMSVTRESFVKPIAVGACRQQRCGEDAI